MYLYAYTIRQIRPSGDVETTCGSWVRENPIRTHDEYSQVVKDIGSLCGFTNGVMESFSLIHSPSDATEVKTLEQHRAEFEAFQKYDLERCDEGYYINIDALNNWGLWKAARGICEPGTRDCDPD